MGCIKYGGNFSSLMKVLREESFLFLAVEGSKNWSMKLSIPHQGGHTTESSAFQVLCYLFSFLVIFQCPLMSLPAFDSLTWKEAGRWDEDKTEWQFEITWPFSDWRLLTEVSTSSIDVVVRRGCCTLLFWPSGTRMSNIAQVIEQELLCSLGSLQGPYMP